jgi:hypothetical protein
MVQITANPGSREVWILAGTWIAGRPSLPQRYRGSVSGDKPNHALIHHVSKATQQLRWSRSFGQFFIQGLDQSGISSTVQAFFK